MRRIWLAITVLTIAVFMSMTIKAHADVNDFTINSFSADYTLDNRDKQGRLEVTEKITVTFTDNNHGIVRAVPKSYKRKSLQVDVRSVVSSSGAPAQYTTSSQNDNLLIKIGDPNRTVTGLQEYTISYTVRNVIGFYDTYDELYWDINGDQWDQPATKVDVSIHVPAQLKVTNTSCFAGGYGETTKYCSVQQSGSVVAATSTQPLAARQTLSTVVAFQKGYFSVPTRGEWITEHLFQILSVVLPPLIVGAWVARRWFRYGRDLKGKGVIIPEYSAPEGLSPAEVGMIYDYKVGQKDITATIIDLAIRKHLVIVEETKKKIFKDQTTYSFRRLKSDTSSLLPHELTVLKSIFPNLSEGEEVELSSLKNKFYITIASIQKSLPAKLTDKGYFVSDPTKAGTRVTLLAGTMFGAAFFIRSWLSLGLILAALISFGFAAFMSKRTQKGVDTKDAIEGLKLYMNTAEKERLTLLQSVDAKYASPKTEPKQTVDLFEKLLPYAMVLGVEETWAKQFKDIYTTPPEWYSGNWHTFNTVYFASSLHNSMQAMNTSFSPPSNSGSSGFGGGGFSGGGGGGGGGGGW